MKTTIPFLCALAILGGAFSHAHEEGERGGQGGAPRGEGGPRGGGPGGFLSRLPVMKALDKNQDGELSAEEIAGASAALITLDKDGDGKLSAEELRPVMQPRGETAHQTAERTFEAFDKNKDGKLTADELPERMKTMIERADANKDGSVDHEELEGLIKKENPAPAPRGEGGPRPEGEAPKPGV